MHTYYTIFNYYVIVLSPTIKQIQLIELYNVKNIRILNMQWKYFNDLEMKNTRRNATTNKWNMY